MAPNHGRHSKTVLHMKGNRPHRSMGDVQNSQLTEQPKKSVCRGPGFTSGIHVTAGGLIFPELKYSQSMELSKNSVDKMFSMYLTHQVYTD